MRRTNRISLLLVWLLPLPVLMGSGTSVAPSEPSPDQPRTYLRHGETLAAQSRNESERDAARRVLAMGVLLAERDGDHELAASGCIALADTHEDPGLRARAWDLALLLDPSRLNSWSQWRVLATDQESARLGAQCLRLARNAKPGDAATLFNRPDVREAIMQAAKRLGYTEEAVRGVLMPLMGTSRNDDCRGRVFYARVEDGVSRRVLCGDHDHPVGGTGDPARLRVLLSIELECLNERGGLESWAGSAYMGRDKPTAVPDLDWLVDQYGIDPTRPYLNDGQWVTEP